MTGGLEDRSWASSHSHKESTPDEIIAAARASATALRVRPDGSRCLPPDFRRSRASSIAVVSHHCGTLLRPAKQARDYHRSGLIVPPSTEANALAHTVLAELRDRTRADLLSYEKASLAVIRGRSGTAYNAKVSSFLDCDDPDSRPIRHGQGPPRRTSARPVGPRRFS
jgi:hypothetical protein